MRWPDVPPLDGSDDAARCFDGVVTDEMLPVDERAAAVWGFVAGMAWLMSVLAENGERLSQDSLLKIEAEGVARCASVMPTWEASGE